MLTENQKRRIENTVYEILKESIFEVNHEPSAHTGAKVMQAKRDSVMKWLDNDQTNQAALAYKLDHVENGDANEKGTARSEFYKKEKGQDADGKPYHFTDDEITRLYNMKDDFIEDLDEAVRKSIKKILA